MIGHRAVQIASCLGLAIAVGLGVAHNPLITIAGLTALIGLAWVLTSPHSFAIAGLVAIMFARTLEARFGAIFASLDEAYVLVCVLAFPLRRSMSGSTLRRVPGAVYFLAFFLLGVLSAIVADVPVAQIAEGGFLMAKGVLLAWAFAQLPWPDGVLHRLTKTLVGVVVVLAVGVLGNLAAPGVWSSAILGKAAASTSRFGLDAVTSFFAHPGYLGSVASMACIAAVAYRATFGRSRTNTLLIAASSAIVLLTLRRKVAAGLIASLWWLRIRLGRTSALGLTLLLAPAFLYFSFQVLQPVIEYTRQEYLSNPDGVARLRLTFDAPAVASENFPFGAGFSQFGSAAARSNYSEIYYELGYPSVYGLGPTVETGQFLTDTFWPAVLGEAGYFGLATYAMMLVAIYRLFLKLARRDGYSKFLGITGMGLSVQMLVESVAGPTYMAVPTFALFFGLVGICVALNDPSERTRSADDVEVSSPRSSQSRPF